MRYTVGMATKQITKKTTTTTNKKVAPAKKRSTAVSAKKAPESHKVDYYPNRMTVAVSALAGSVLVLFAVIAVLGSK